MTATATETLEDAALALADAEPECEWNHPATQNTSGPKCERPAEWAGRVHGDSAHSGCPRIVLYCSPHVKAAQLAYLHCWLSLPPKRLSCAACRARIVNVDSLLWGFERLRP